MTTYFASNHDEVLGVQALQNCATLITNADDFDAWILGQIATNDTGNTSVNGSAQAWN
jgi:hypothetical protein